MEKRIELERRGKAPHEVRPHFQACQLFADCLNGKVILTKIVHIVRMHTFAIRTFTLSGQFRNLYLVCPVF